MKPANEIHSSTNRCSNDDVEAGQGWNAPTALPNPQTVVAIDDVSHVGGFSGRLLTMAIEESGEELVEALFGLFAKLQTRRLETSKTGTSATSVPSTKQERVFIQAIFQRVGDIDTAKESFWASVCIQAKWREPKLDGELTLKPEQVTWTDYWNPGIYIGNYLGNAQKEDIVTRDLIFNGNEAYVIEKHQLTGAFHEKLELEKFPFDIQKFKVVILSKLSTSDVTLVVDEDQSRTAINTESFEDKQEWRLYSNVSLDTEDEDELPNESLPLFRQFQNQPQLLATSTASRQYGFYLTNFMFTMFFITCMSFCTFAIHYAKVENRLQVTVILLLTTIAFKNVVNSFLPRYSYLTYLDIYILSSMVLLGLVCIWHAVAGALGPDRINFWVDKAVLIMIVLLYAFFNFVYVVIYIKARMARYNLKQKELTYIGQLVEAKSNVNAAMEKRESSETFALYGSIRNS